VLILSNNKNRLKLSRVHLTYLYVKSVFLTNFFEGHVHIHVAVYIFSLLVLDKDYSLFISLEVVKLVES